jgi:hypothetical protein
MSVRRQEDAPPRAAVAAVGASQRHVLLTTKADASIASCASLDEDLHVVEEGPAHFKNLAYLRNVASVKELSTPCRLWSDG